MIKTIPHDTAPPGEEALYKQVWDYHLWGFTVQDIYATLNAQDPSITQAKVRSALDEMKKALDDLPYEELNENEIRSYLARNYQAEEELLELYLQAKSDMQLLRSGQTRHPDGSRPMSVDIKMLQGLLTAIEKQGQARVTLLSKLTQANQSGGGPPRLEDEEAQKELMDSLARKPTESAPVDVQFEEVQN